MSSILALKLLLAPSMILLVSLAARRWGSTVGGMLAGLPIIAGPIILVLGLEQGGSFGRAAAAGALGGVISLGVFCFVYAWMSTRYAVRYCIASGWSSFLIFTVVLNYIAPSPLALFPFVIATIATLTYFAPVPEPTASPVLIAGSEIILRMIAACCLVLLISSLAQPLGPQLSGLLAPFPVAGSVLSVFTHRYQGVHAATALLRGFIRGLFGMAVFCFVIAISEPLFGFLPGVLLALVFTLVTAFFNTVAHRRLAASTLTS